MVEDREMIRSAILFSLALLAWQTSAQTIQNFRWQASSRFFLDVADGQAPLEFKGYLRLGQTAHAEQSGVTADLKDYGGFVSVLLSEDGSDQTSLFILEEQNAKFVPLNSRAIVARKATAAKDLDDAVEGLKKTLSWDPSQSFRAMISYFGTHPQNDLTAFADDVERGQINVVARPPTRLTGNTAPVNSPPQVDERTSESSPSISPDLLPPDDPDYQQPQRVPMNGRRQILLPRGLPPPASSPQMDGRYVPDTQMDSGGGDEGAWPFGN